jgi:hypothetical protein
VTLHASLSVSGTGVRISLDYSRMGLVVVPWVIDQPQVGAGVHAWEIAAVPGNRKVRPEHGAESVAVRGLIRMAGGR